MEPFKFKEFSVHHNRCAAKIGTDGVLLGAWTPIASNPDSILDIGTGTGIIALMLAQRSAAQTIDALELDNDAFEQATENFENSPWGDRLFCYHAHLYEFATEIDDTYDLIVSNPPFYKAEFKTTNSARDMARFEDAMPFDLLIGAVAKLLSPAGSFCTILPTDRVEEFVALSAQAKLFLKQITHVKGTPNTTAKRSLMVFERNIQRDSEPEIHTLIIENDRHKYTPEYIDLTKDFYLKM